MIPKTIHYVWFGGNPLDERSERCIASWREKCPDYRILRWDESNFDVRRNKYCAEAYRQRKWAFVSDYARLWILVNHGGIYMDTDVEVIKPLDEFLHHEAFSGFQKTDEVPTGLMACRKGFPLFSEFLKDYDKRDFVFDEINPDALTNVTAITQACLRKGLVLDGSYQIVDGFALYPADWFCAKDVVTLQTNITGNTHSIHHFAGSWLSPADKAIKDYKQVLLSRHQNMPNKVAGAVARLRYSVKSGDYKAIADGLKRHFTGQRNS